MKYSFQFGSLHRHLAIRMERCHLCQCLWTVGKTVALSTVYFIPFSISLDHYSTVVVSCSKCGFCFKKNVGYRIHLTFPPTVARRGFSGGSVLRSGSYLWSLVMASFILVLMAGERRILDCHDALEQES